MLVVRRSPGDDQHCSILLVEFNMATLLFLLIRSLRTTHVNRKGRFALFSRDFEQILGQIVSLSEKTLTNTNLVLRRNIDKKKVYFWLRSVAQKVAV